MELVVNTFKLEKSLNDQLSTYAKEHHVSKSDLIRQAIIDRLNDLDDLAAFERTKGDRIYSLKEVEEKLSLAD